MRDEWDFNDPAINEESTEEVPEEGTVHDNTWAADSESVQESMSAEENESIEQVSEDANEVTQNDTAYDANEPMQEGESAGEETAVPENENGAYHWVNPELAKRQKGAATEEQNTYVASNFREHVDQRDWKNSEQSGYQVQNGQQTQGGYQSVNPQNGQNDQQQMPYWWVQKQQQNQTQQQNRYQDQQQNQYRTQQQNQYQDQQQDQYQTQQQNQTQQQSAGYNGQGTGYHDQSYQGGWNTFTNNNPRTGERQYGSYQFSQENPVKETKQKEKKKKEKKPKGTGSKFLVTVALAAVFGVVAGGVMFGVNRLGNTILGEPEQETARVEIPAVETPEKKETTSDTGSQSTGEGQYSVAQVAANCMPSVVSITNASVTTVRDFFGGQQEYLSESSGSGIIVGQNDTELLIATNNHVVDGASTITVAFTDEAICEAQVKGTDSGNDLAVIAVKLSDMAEETQSAIRIASIGDSDSLQVGEQVVAIGNALGYGQSVTSGWVSALNREMVDTDGKSTGQLIQTDAAINPGNSGGALLNMKGELIGINSAKAAATEVEGMGYAIPISVAEPILDELMNRETRYIVDDEAKTSYIGVSCLSVDSASAQMYGIPTGAFVDSVEEGGPAANAGIIKGDVIAKFDGLTIDSSTKLVETLQYYEAGETVEVVIYRAENGEYKEHVLSVTLGKRSEMKQQ